VLHVAYFVLRSISRSNPSYFIFYGTSTITGNPLSTVIMGTTICVDVEERPEVQIKHWMDSFTEPLAGEGSLYSPHQLGCKMPPFAGLCTRVVVALG